MILNYVGDDLVSSIGIRDFMPYIGFIRRSDLPAGIKEKMDADEDMTEEDRRNVVEAVATLGAMIRLESPHAASAFFAAASCLHELVYSPQDEGLMIGDAGAKAAVH